eukprot:1078032-Prymnesium_polylepis.1
MAYDLWCAVWRQRALRAPCGALWHEVRVDERPVVRRKAVLERYAALRCLWHVSLGDLIGSDSL